MRPFCNSSFSRVIATERYDRWTRRRQKCRNCSGEYYTKEEFNGAIKPPPNTIPSSDSQADKNGHKTRVKADRNGQRAKPTSTLAMRLCARLAVSVF